MCVTRTDLCHLADAPGRGLCHSGEVAGWGSGAGQVAPYKGGAGTAGAGPGGVAASADYRAVSDVSTSQTRVVALEDERCGGIQQKGA
jgi:hypothetical protein